MTTNCRTMQNGFDIDGLLDALAEKVAVRLRAELECRTATTATVRPRLLTVDQAATYLGRSKASVQHLISDQAIPVVRHDRRVFLDVRDLDGWIDAAKV